MDTVVYPKAQTPDAALKNLVESIHKGDYQQFRAYATESHTHPEVTAIAFEFNCTVLEFQEEFDSQFGPDRWIDFSEARGQKTNLRLVPDRFPEDTDWIEGAWEHISPSLARFRYPDSSTDSLIRYHAEADCWTVDLREAGTEVEQFELGEELLRRMQRGIAKATVAIRKSETDFNELHDIIGRSLISDI